MYCVCNIDKTTIDNRHWLSTSENNLPTTLGLLVYSIESPRILVSICHLSNSDSTVVYIHTVYYCVCDIDKTTIDNKHWLSTSEHNLPTTLGLLVYSIESPRIVASFCHLSNSDSTVVYIYGNQ